MQPKLIVFDLNHTLIRDNSWRNLNLAMGITPEEDAALMARAAQGEITDAEGQAWLLQRYRQRGDCHREAVQRVLSQYTYMPPCSNGRCSASSARLPRGYQLWCDGYLGKHGSRAAWRRALAREQSFYL